MGDEHVRTRDGRKLYSERRGDGAPIVVFESGLGVSRNMWGAVAPAVAEHTTTVVYDRAGLGRSPRDHEPRDLARLAGDHLDVLAHLGEGPFVLVGHSWGGPVVRTAAAALPNRVAGLVLVDPTDESCDLFFSKGNARQTRAMMVLLPALASLGLIRAGVRKLANQLPEPAATAMLEEDARISSVHAQVAELHPNLEDLRRLRKVPPRVPDIPVTVISGLAPSWLERGRRGELVAAHRATAAALPHGRHVGASRSSHYVPVTEPQLVAEEILRIVTAVQTPGSP